MLKRIRQIGIACALKKLKHVLFLDEDAKSIAARHGAHEYLLRYAYICPKTRENWKPGDKSKTIWTCWWQGENNAPLLVKKCIDSMRQYAGENKVVVIDEHNMKEYITLPDYIIRKHNEGIIPHTQFSDIVRLALLQKYGGCWIDATILLTDQLPQYIQEANLFCFRSDGRGDVKLATPFMSSCADHPVINDVLALHYEYWRHENKLVSYSIVHLFFTIAIEASLLNKSLWDAMPLVYSYKMDYLQPQLGKTYTEQVYQLATQLSSIHKLTYKFEQFGIDINKKGTFYYVLINGNKPC